MDDAEATLERVRSRIDGHDFDFTASMYGSLMITNHVVSAPEVSGAASASARTELSHAIGRPSINWGGWANWMIGAAAAGDLDATRALFDETETAVQNSDDDRLPDLLIPFAALAWALGARERAARWITAVRRSPTPTQNFGFTIAYRQLRDAVGLLDENPLDDATIEEIYHEATDWLASL